MILEVRDIHTYYGKSHILFGISLDLGRNEVVCLLGRNGTGKTTLFRSIMSLTPVRRGSIKFHGEEISKKASYQISSMGIGLVPQGRRVFTDLTVRENIEVVKKKPVPSDRDWTVDRLYALFPKLQELDTRLAGSLSGGEQQMLAISRTLACNPDLILLDEPSEGLGPLMVEALKESIEAATKGGEVTIFLAEQNVKFALTLAKRSYIVEKGRVAWSGEARALVEDEEVKKRFIAI